MSNKNLTKTLFADFRKVDTKKLNINGNPFSKVISSNVPDSPTENDIWKYAATTDDNGVVTINSDISFDYSEMTDAQKAITQTAVKVIDNKVLDANDLVLMNWNTAMFTNNNNGNMNSIFNGSKNLTEWKSDLSSLTNGYFMFYNTDIKSFTSDLSSLTNGFGMFYNTDIESFTSDLSSLTNGFGMFACCTNLTSFNSDLSSLTNGSNMFNRCTNLTSFNSDLSNLKNGSGMFYYCTKLATFDSDLSNLTNISGMFLGCTALTTFNGDLSSLTNSERMFYGCSNLITFNGDLSSLTHGSYMFYDTALESFNSDLSSLTNGHRMFYNCSNLTSFDSDLSSLIYGSYMFGKCHFTTFDSDLSSLTDGSYMFYNTALESFDSDLSSLTNGRSMFLGCTALTSFNSDLSKLTDGKLMFYNTALTTFNSDLSSLTNGYFMFYNTQARHYNVSFYEMVDGVKTEVRKTLQSEGLKEVVSDFSSLKSGYYMFGNGKEKTNSYTDDDGNEVTETTYNISPLSEDSIMFIAETINDISKLDTTNSEHWKYTYISDGNEYTTTIHSTYRGIIHLGYDSSITDTTNIMKYCDQIAAKGWTVFLNGSQQTPNNGAIETANLSDDSVQTPIPHYYKPLQVTDDNVAEYVDTNGNYYIIIGGQHVFGDDISTYGTFTSYDHAVSEITLGLGLTKYVKPTEEETESEEEKQ